MRYFRNNREKAVIRENDNDRRYYKVFDDINHCASEEIATNADSKIAYGEVGIGIRYPLTEVSKGWYDGFGIDWRYDTSNGHNILLLDRRTYTQEMIDQHNALDDIYNDGEPFDDIYEVLGDV